ncbi:MAG: dimethylarginine dimethylaminohydrolase family protein [Candidatus Thorarchaeota archaeon]|jgi:dimethylargininase
MTNKRAIVRPPGRNFKNCLSDHPLHHTLDLELALEQHNLYKRTLSDLGLDLIELEPSDDHPDACFVEDTVVVHNSRAIVTRMARESRRGESSGVESVLSDFKQIDSVNAPGTLEGGDVIHLPDSLICGITERTNHDGASQMEHWLETYVHRIEDPNIMHIKSHLTYLGKDIVVCNPKYVDHPVLDSFTKIVLPVEESHSANTLAIEDVVIMSAKHNMTTSMVREAGFDVIQLNMSEFEKCDGALTCLSIIF